MSKEEHKENSGKSGRSFKNTTEEGKAGEQLVANYLIAKGFTIIERNWKPSPASKLEIDLIATKDMLMIFVEVKTRKGNHSDPIDAVDRRKIVNTSKAADAYLRQQPYMFEYRFDIAGVTDPLSANPKIEYIEDAFMPPFGNR